MNSGTLLNRSPPLPHIISPFQLLQSSSPFFFLKRKTEKKVENRWENIISICFLTNPTWGNTLADVQSSAQPVPHVQASLGLFILYIPFLSHHTWGHRANFFWNADKSKLKSSIERKVSQCAEISKEGNISLENYRSVSNASFLGKILDHELTSQC